VQITLLMVMVMVMVMRVGMIMMVLMILCNHRCPHAVVVVMDIPLMVIVVVNDQGARCALLMGMMIVLMTMFMVVLMSVLMVMIVITFMAGDPRLAASAYATHINLPRCR
jgi:hypothetical protein